MFEKLLRSLKTLYSAQPLTRRLVQNVSHSRIYHRLTHWRVARQSQKDLTGSFNLVIETSNLCNAHCLMCPHETMRRAQKVMDQKIFDQVVERIKTSQQPINKVFLSGLGEPLTDPQLIIRLQTFKALGLRVKLYTNAALLKPSIAPDLVGLRLDEINISFNAAKPETYHRVMGLDFEQTKANVENLLRIKKEKQSSLPHVLISLVVTRENASEIATHLKLWRDKVDSVTVSLAHQWGGGVNIDSQFKTNSTVYPCRSLWHTLVVDVDGNFVLCCRDFESKQVLGHVSTHDFDQIRLSPILQNFRQKHLEFAQAKLPAICQACNFPYQDGVEWYLPRMID